jgi:hypothetical protein
MNQGLHSTQQIRIQNALSAVFQGLIWVYALVAIVSSFAVPVQKFDDAIPLIHGTLIRQGYTPNLDFYSFYPPLVLYLNAAAFIVLGQTVMAPRVAAGMLFVVVLLLALWFFRSRYRSDPLVPAAVLLVAVTAGTALPMPVWPGFVISLAALMVYLISREGGRNRRWLVVLSGLVAGTAVLCRVNFGGYAVFVIALDFLRRSLLDGVGGFRSRLKSEVPMIAAFALPLVLFCLGVSLWIYGSRVGVGLSQFVVLAQRMMTRGRFLDLRLDVAFPVTLPFLWFFVRLLKGADTFVVRSIVPVVLGAGVLMLVLAGGRQPTIVPIVVAVEVALVLFMHVFLRRLDAMELNILLFYCCLLHYYLSRADQAHWRLIPVTGALLLPFLVLGHDKPNTHSEVVTPMGTALSVLTVAILAAVGTPEFRPGLSTIPRGLVLISNVIRDRSTSDSDRMLGPIPPSQAWNAVYADENELAALQYVRGKTSASTPLFVGYRDHSRVFWNDLRMYWLAGRPIAVRTFQLETRTATEEPVQREIITDLEERKNTWIILDSELEGDEGFFKANYQGSSLLDDYIGTNFRRVASFGPYWVFTRATD